MDISTKRKKSFESYLPLLAFVLAGLCAIVSFFFADFLPGRNWVDMTDAFTASAAYSRMLTRHLFDGAGMFYSHELSLGQNTSMAYAMYAYSPFGLLYFLPFDTYTVLIITHILRVAFAAAFFNLFLRDRMGIKDLSSVFFSLCYSLSAFHIFFLSSANFDDGVYLLPLLMWVLFGYIKSQKGIKLCLCYALCFISNFYAGYVIGLVSFTALLLFLFIRDRSAFIKKNLRLLTKYAFIVIIALMISMLFLLPAFTFYVQIMSGQFNGTFLSAVSLPTLLSGLFYGIHNNVMDNYSAMYCGTPVLLLLILYFFNRKIARRERIIMLLSLLSFFPTYYITPLYHALHAFNPPTGFPMRYAYAYIFLIILLAARQYSHMETSLFFSKRGQLLSLSLFIIAAMLLLMFGRQASYSALIINIMLISIWVVYFVLRKKIIKPFIVSSIGLLLISGELCCSIAIGYPDDFPAQDYHFYVAQLPDTISKIKDAQKDGQLYRARISNTLSPNLPSEYGFVGTGIFGTAVYPALHLFMLRMGDNANGYTYSMNGLTDLTEMLLGIRYQARLDSPNNVFGHDTYYYTTNMNALPIGFSVSEDITGIPSLGINPFDNLNSILSSMLGKTEKAYIPTPLPEIAVQDMIAYYTDDGKFFMQRNNADAPGMLSLSIPKGSYEHAYFMFSNLSEDRTPSERRFLPDEAQVSLYSENDRYTPGVRGPETLSPTKGITEMDTEDDLFYVLLLNNKNLETQTTYEHVYSYYQDDSVISYAYDKLSECGWRINSYDSLHIDATAYTTEEYPVLFLSIPYDPGWECIADGKEAEIISVIDKTFMAVKLSPGTHDIKLTYHVPGLNTGFIIFLIGMISLIILIIYEKTSQFKKTTDQAQCIDKE